MYRQEIILFPAGLLLEIYRSLVATCGGKMISFLKIFQRKFINSGYGHSHFRFRTGWARPFLFSAGLAIGLVSIHAQASDSAHTFDQLKAALLDARQVTAILDLAQCQDINGNGGPHIRSGFLIPSFMIIENQGTPSIAFSLSHETVEKKNDQLRTEFVRFTVMSNHSVDVDTFLYFPGATTATRMGSWRCRIDKGVHFGW